MQYNRLFALIKSLSKSEKRYFKLMSQLQEGNKNYLKLFDAIYKQESYNEDIIREQFRKEKFMRNLPEAKSYLMGMILKTLRNHNKPATVHDELLLLYTDARLLINKSLFKHAWLIIQKIKKIAGAVDKYDFVSMALELEESIASRSGEYIIPADEIRKSFTERVDAILKNKNVVEYTGLNWQLANKFSKVGVVRDNEQKKEFDKLLSH